MHRHKHIIGIAILIITHPVVGKTVHGRWVTGLFRVEDEEYGVNLPSPVATRPKIVLKNLYIYCIISVIYIVIMSGGWRHNNRTYKASVLTRPERITRPIIKFESNWYVFSEGKHVLLAYKKTVNYYKTYFNSNQYKNVIN